MIPELHLMLEGVAARFRRVRLWSQLACCWLFWALVGFTLAATSAHFGWQGTGAWTWLIGAALATAAVCWLNSAKWARDVRWVAQRVEDNHPELGTLLLAALDQTPSAENLRLGYLQATVVQNAVEHGKSHNWNRAVPTRRVRLVQLAQFASLALLIAACMLLASQAGARASSGLELSDSELPDDGAGFGVDVQPGNVEIERGTSLLVVARFDQLVPAEATLVLLDVPDSSAGQKIPSIREREMTRSLDDPQFVGRVPSISRHLDYYVEFAGRRTPTYRATVFDFPHLVRADAALEYPAYTSLEAKIVQDIRHVTAVEGTTLTLTCRLNKEVEVARLIDRDGVEIAMERSDASEPVVKATMLLSRSRRWKLHLQDNAQRRNKLPPEFVINVTPNRAPVIEIDRPGRDLRVSPLEEMLVSATLTDDYGFLGQGVAFALGGDPREQAVCQLDQPADEQPHRLKLQLSTLIDLEALQAQPDQLLSYYVWAEDVGPDGQPRRTMSPMYFAEVRHLEEIFREGEQPAGGQFGQQPGPGAGQQSQELAEIQKQIVNGTWTVVRQETGESFSAASGEDVGLLHDSQQYLIERLDELSTQLADQQSLAHAAAAKEHMTAAAVQLALAVEDGTIDTLHTAISAEQASYQALLKLRAREFEIVRGGQPGGQPGSASGPGSRSQEQLRQLELSSDRNRYETQSRADSARNQQEQAAELSAARRMLDRLRDLARRQEDLTQRLRELQSALEAAENPAQREEIERELQRLRDRQREILREADQLNSEMEATSDQDSSQAQEQLSQTRSRIQRATEALEQGQLSQALTEGARAGRELSEIRDQLRQQTADRFSEEMRELRDDARELDEKQQQLSEDLAQINQERSSSLRDGGAREEVATGLDQQRQQLGEVIEQMQTIVSEAEETEPLLARELYESVRQSTVQQTDEALDIAQQLMEAGVAREATDAMRVANQGIGDLRSGIDRAAESVLGDDTESLRRAEQQLRSLAEELDREIDAAQGKSRESGQIVSGEPSQPSDQPAGPAPPGPPSDQPGNAESMEPPPSAEAGPGGPGNSEVDAQSPAPQSDPGQPGGTGNRNAEGLLEQFLTGGTGPGGPITGQDFREWADRMRDIEAMLDDPEFRAEAARIRDRAEQARAEFKRHSRMPDWSKLNDMVAEPLDELRQRIGAEIRRRESPEALVPIDRDPVPAEHAEQIRLYYERLGSGA